MFYSFYFFIALFFPKLDRFLNGSRAAHKSVYLYRVVVVGETPDAMAASATHSTRSQHSVTVRSRSASSGISDGDRERALSVKKQYFRTSFSFILSIIIFATFRVQRRVPPERGLCRSIKIKIPIRICPRTFFRPFAILVRFTTIFTLYDYYFSTVSLLLQ